MLSGAIQMLQEPIFSESYEKIVAFWYTVKNLFVGTDAGLLFECSQGYHLMFISKSRSSFSEHCFTKYEWAYF